MELAGPGGSPEPAPAAPLGEEPAAPPDGVSLDFRALFEVAPGVHLVLAPDAPRFTMLAASDERLAATLTTRAQTIGRPLFEVFPDANPENAEPSGVANLRASLETVLRTRAPHRMAVQRYDLRRPDGGWEVRYWAPRNVPVLAPDGAVRYLVHHVEDVTDLVLAREATATAERAHDRTARLQALTAALAAAHTLDDVATVVVADMVVALGATTGALAVRASEGGAQEAASVVLLRTVGFPEPGAVRHQADDLASALTECVRTASPVWVESRDGPIELDVRDPAIAPVWDALGLAAAAFIPLVAAGEAVGAIAFGFGGPRTFDPAERAFLLALGRQAALAVERARLDAAERGARRALEELLAASEAANARLRIQEQELALANQQLQDQAAELELQAEELQAAAAQLEERTEDAERARADAEAERARAAGILETMADAHFVLDREFRFVSANAATERNLGRAREALLGRTIWELFPGTVGTVFEASYRRVAAEGIAVHFTGAYDEGGLALVPEVDAYPTPEGGVAVFWRDVRARLQAAAALRASEQRLRDVFEQAPVAVAVLTGPDHVYTAVSPMYAASPGLGRPLLGRPLRDAFPEVVEQGYLAAIRRVYETGVPFAAAERPVLLARPGDGTREERFFNIGYQPLRDPAGTVYAVASVAYDVTEQVRARQDVEAARAEAERQRAVADVANQAKTEFLSTMSHELRTPLNAIGGYAQLLELGLHGPVTSEQLAALGRIQRGQQHLLGLINAVLNYAKLEAGHVEYHVADVPAAETLAEVAALVAPQARAKGLSLDVRGGDPVGADHDRALVARADPEKTRQVLLNLLSNAVKFTRGGGTVTLSCRHVVDGDSGHRHAAFIVTDTGRGIAADQLVRVFDPFVQVDQGLTRTEEGTGLGLAISRDLARGMGGDLTVESTLGVGSTFTLTLPAA